MIQHRTMLKVVDNTGAKIIQCIQVLVGSKRKWGQIGDIIVAVVKEAEPRRQVKEHEIVRAVIVRQKKSYRRSDGSYIRFDDNAAVILEAKKEPKGEEFWGRFRESLKKKDLKKSLA